MKKVKKILMGTVFFMLLVGGFTQRVYAKNQIGTTQYIGVKLKNSPTNYNVVMAKHNNLDITCRMWGDVIKTSMMTYSSSNNGVISVNSRGIAKAKGAGSATVICEMDSKYIRRRAYIHISVRDKVHINKIKAEKNLKIEKGSYEYLNVDVFPDYAPDRRMIYKSSNKNIVKVDKDGKCFGINKGTATITVISKDGKKKSKSKVSVVDPIVYGVSIQGLKQYYFEGTTAVATATISPDYAQDTGVVWKSNNTNVADIDQNGNVTFNAAGNVEISATSKLNPSVSGVATINVKELIDSIWITGESTCYLEDGSTTLKASVSPYDSPNKTVIWSVDKPEIADVDQNGKVTFKKCGFVNVYAEGAVNHNKRDSQYIEIKTNAPDSVEIDNKYLIDTQMQPGEEKTLIASVPLFSKDPQYKWESSDDSVISVDNSGNIKALKPGTATISVSTRWNDKMGIYPSDSLTFTVLSDNVATGACGNYAVYSLTGYKNNLTLTITGEGYVSYSGWASYRSRIKNIVIDDRITGFCDGAFKNTDIATINLPSNIGKIGKDVFSGCSNLKKIHIPEGCTEIGEYAFFNNKSLELAEIPSTVKKIGKSSFNGCTSLKEIHIPEGVLKLDVYSFEQCTGLEKVSIPSTIKEIDWWAFDDCKNIKEVIFNGTSKEWNDIIIGEHNTYLNISKKTFLKDDSKE